MNRDWLEEGSLHVLLPHPLLDAWTGSKGEDYDRASAASDEWLTLLPLAGGCGLVLGGDVAMTLAVPAGPDSACVIRWLFAEGEEELVQFALSGHSRKESEPDLVIENEHQCWHLFDAALSPGFHSPAVRSLVLPLGPIRVQTSHNANDRNGAIIHRFRSAA